MGIDIGTSSCKVGVYNHKGECIALEHSYYSKVELDSQWIEYNPNDWWKGVKACLHRLFSERGVTPSDIEAIGLSGQICTHLIVDVKGEPIGNAISWQDVRAGAEAEELAGIFPDDKLDKEIGAHLPSGACWPLPRLMWMHKHEKEKMTKAYKWLQAKEFILLKLTGEFSSDLSSLRGIVNPYTGAVSKNLTDRLNLRPAEYLPPILEPWDIGGRITAQVSGDTGLVCGTPVVVGWNDFHSALLGTGVTDSGDAFNITGTSDHIGVIIDNTSGAQDKSLARYPLIAGKTDVLYGVISSGGGSLNWFMKAFHCMKEGKSFREAFDNLLIECDSSKGLIFLPYLRGERAPIWNVDARGTFFGVDMDHKLGHFMFSVMEGVAFNLRQAFELAGDHFGKVESLKASGGAAANKVWNQIKANILKKNVVLTKCSDSSCLGAAMLAAIGTGWYSDLKSAAQHMVSISDVFVPQTDKTEFYDEIYDIYKSLYPDLKEEYKRLAGIRHINL